jgi:predicted ATPase/DNA-binding CsgD family transcriptional regulator/transcriptional regulator with XRE-family HTH domain
MAAVDPGPATSVVPLELFERRRALGMSQRELGAILGVRANTVARWERGDLPIGSPLLLRLALERLEMSHISSRDGLAWAAGNRSARESQSLPGTVPLAPGRLIGRQSELAFIEAALVHSDNRLLTLVGPGGVGKSRLAIAAANQCQSAFADGVTFVDLAPLSSDDMVPAAIADAFGLQEAGLVPALGLLRRHLRHRHVLVVLDNFEHVLPAAAAVAELLSTCPRLKIVVTSREPLRLRVERRLIVPTLSLPAGSDTSLEQIEGSTAVEMFVDCCRSADPSFTLEPSNAQAVAGICAGLDGLPLALELAAARARALPPWTMLQHLAELPQLLRAGGSDTPARHRTLRATVDWSYELLEPDEKVLFRRLAVFAGGATLDATEQVCSDRRISRPDVLALMGELVDKSLVQVEVSDADSPVRYRMLETLRQYGLERLEQLGEAKRIHARQLQWCRGLIESAAPEFWTRNQVLWLDRLEQEYANLRTAIVYTLARGGPSENVESALYILAVAWPFWDIRGHLRQAREWLERLLGLPSARAVTAEVRAQAVLAMGWLSYGLGDLTAALAWMNQAHEMWTALGSRYGLAWSAAMQGLVAFNLGDTERAENLFRTAAATGQHTGDALLMAWAAFGQAHLRLLAGETREAIELLEAALHADSTQFGPVGKAFGLFSLGQSFFVAGDRGRAEALTRECLALRWAAQDLRALPETLEALAAFAAADGSHERAARLFAGGEVARQLTGTQLHPWLQARRDAGRAAVREALGSATFDQLWSDTEHVPLSRTIESVLVEAQPTRSPLLHEFDSAAPLTPREREVAAKLARGMSNREIASDLVISERTAEAHVEHIRNKLQVSTRGQIAVWAAQHGLLADK